MAEDGGVLEPSKTRVVNHSAQPEHLVDPPGDVAHTPQQEEQAMLDKPDIPAPSEPPRPASGVARVIYRGPAGHFVDGKFVMHQDGDPVEIPQDRLQHLRFTFPEHNFEEQ